MLRKITIISFAALGLPALAADFVSLDEVIKGSLGDASARVLVGKSVVVNPTRFGELGFAIAKANDVTFVCRSGEKTLTAKKPKAISFEGVLAKAQGWEGTTIWEVKDCKSTASVSGADLTTQPVSQGKRSTVYSAGNKHWSGDVTVAGANVSISTASERGTCDLSGKANYQSAAFAVLTSSDDAQCKAQLTFTATSVKVKTDGCNSFCGASGPGFDYEYRLKAK